MNDITFRQIQALELKALLEQAADDPLLRGQLAGRVEDAERALAEARHDPDSPLIPREAASVPRMAIFLRGGGVENQTGIRPALAAAALAQYEKMYIEQALHDERELARSLGRQRRPRGATTPELLFTGTPRGSFGLEFSPQPSDDPTQSKLHAKSMANVANAIVAVASGDEQSFIRAVGPIPSGMIHPMKQFFETLATFGAEIRLASNTAAPMRLDGTSIRLASERLEKSVMQEDVTEYGTLRGVTRESGYFDLRLDSGELITGTVDDSFTEEQLERIDRLTNQRCVALLRRTTVSTVSGSYPAGYVLLKADPVDAQGNSGSAIAPPSMHG